MHETSHETSAQVKACPMHPHKSLGAARDEASLCVFESLSTVLHKGVNTTSLPCDTPKFCFRLAAKATAFHLEELLEQPQESPSVVERSSTGCLRNTER